jgi:hypothetical protein
MIRPMLKRVFPKVLAWALVVAASCLIAVAQSATAAGQRSDGQIEMDVVHALDASKALKNDLIAAATVQSEVTLTGTVASEASRELAESISSQVPGVTKVHNKLKIGNPQEAQSASAEDANAQQMADDAQPESSSSPTSITEQANGPMPASSQPQDDAQPAASSQPQYSQIQPSATTYETPKGPVTVSQGTLLQLRTSEPVSSKSAKEGSQVQFIVIQDVAVGGVLAIPRGATVHGVVSEVKQAGELSGTPELALKLTSLDLGGQNYPLDSDQFKVQGPSKTGHTVGNVLGGAVLGTIIGCAAGRGAGCAIGAVAGAGAGTAVSAASSGQGAWIPDEAKVDFHLTAPVTVTPVDAKEAARLAQGITPGGPTLYQRGDARYRSRYNNSPYYRSPNYPGYYPPVYYRPYYAVGGYYYWR